MKDDVSGLKSLGSSTQYQYEKPSMSILETFPNSTPGGRYKIHLIFPEFTSLCPRTGQPDFATITISYIPDRMCVESKSLKLYLFAFRSEGSFMETTTNRILNDIVAICHPRWCKVVGDFAPRGGIRIKVVATHTQEKENA
jgi:7-cyano-7-deazaguanine reductase